MKFEKDNDLAKLLIEIANLRHPDLKLFPLELKLIQPYSDMLKESEFGLGKLYSFTVSSTLSNGDVKKTVAISFLISAMDQEEGNLELFELP